MHICICKAAVGAESGEDGAGGDANDNDDDYDSDKLCQTNKDDDKPKDKLCVSKVVVLGSALVCC